MCLNDWPIGDDLIGRCGLIGVGVALLEEVGYWGRTFEVSEVQVCLVYLSRILSADQNVGLSVPSPAPCLPPCHHASHNGLSL